MLPTEKPPDRSRPLAAPAADTVAFADDGKVQVRCRRCHTSETIPTYHTMPEIADALLAFHRAHQKCAPRPDPGPDLVLR